jgi:hypothetical protein
MNIEKILRYERELKTNQINILKVQDVALSKTPTLEAVKEYQVLLIQRSNLKDLLLDEYRNEVLERRIEQLEEECPIS